MSQVSKADIAAVVVSVMALVISTMSWLEVREQVALARGQIRSYVQVVDVRLVEPIVDASFIRLQLRMKNFGQTAAVKVYGEMDYNVGIPDPEGKGNEATRREFGSMGPGMERLFILQSNHYHRGDWPIPSLRGGRSVYFFGTIWFTDDTTQQQRKEDWCYELTLKTEADLKRTELEPCTILTYTSR